MSRCVTLCHAVSRCARSEEELETDPLFRCVQSSGVGPIPAGGYAGRRWPFLRRFQFGLRGGETVWASLRADPAIR